MHASAVTFDFPVLRYKIRWPGDNAVTRPHRGSGGGNSSSYMADIRVNLASLYLWRGCGFCGD